MVVSFSDTATATVSTDLVGLLRPQLSVTRRAEQGPRPALLRALCAAIAAGHSPAAIRRTVAAVGSAEQVALSSSRPAWAALVRTARERVEDQASEAGRYRNRLAAARATVARCTTPLPDSRLSPRREALARRAFAVVGVQLATLGFDKIVVSSGWLAQQLGVSDGSARVVIRTLVDDLRWLSPAGKRGLAGRYRLRSLETEELRERAWLHSDTVEELAGGTDETPLAQVLLAAGHPAISYGSESGRTQIWVAWLHQLAGVPSDASLGVNARTRRSLVKCSPVTVGGLDLLDQLDEEAARTAAFAARDAAETKFKRAAAENAARLAAHRAERAQRYQRVRDARYSIRAAIDAVGLPPADRDTAQRWVPAFARALDDVERTPELLTELRSLASRRGWSEQMADAAFRYLELRAA